MQKIVETGEEREDRTGVGTYSLFGETLHFDLQKEFPAVTTKKLAWKSVIGELLWFINGKTSLGHLRYYTFGSRYANKSTIWDANAKDYWNRLPEKENEISESTEDLGSVYGWLWHVHDQFWDCVNMIKNDPKSRRILVNAWIPSVVNDKQMLALPPCHYSFQFYVHNDGRLDLLWNQRSQDMFLGGPFNYASYAALVHIVSRLTGTVPGRLVCNLGDAHIYRNHLGAVKEQLKRVPYSSPQIHMSPEVKTREDLSSATSADFWLDGYKCHSKIQAEMAV